MGIQGLLPVLRSITHKVSIAKYAGKRVAVDAYCWLHKGAYCCSKELCEGGSPDKCDLTPPWPCSILRYSCVKGLRL